MMNCIIVEDEQPAMELMVDNLGKIPYLNLVAKCKNTFMASEILLNEKIDLIFLDIEMPVVSGIQFLKSIRNPPLVILTTAYEKYALNGYELNVVDYLLKPFSFDRFLSAVTKALEQHNFRNGTSEQVKDDGFFFVYSEYREVKIFYKDVLYIKGLKDYVKIFLKDSTNPLLTRLNLRKMESYLPQSLFMRVHNSHIVNLTKISSLQKSQLFIGKKAIPIGPTYVDDFFLVFKGAV